MVKLYIKNNKIELDIPDGMANLVYRAAKIFYRNFKGELQSESLVYNRAIPLGSLELFKKRADRLKLKYEIIDSRTPVISDRKLLYWGDKTPMRHQEEIIASVDKDPCGLISSPTGSGKTLIATLIASQKSCSALIIVPTELAQVNMYEEMVKAFGKKKVSMSVPERPSHVGLVGKQPMYKFQGMKLDVGCEGEADGDSGEIEADSDGFADWLSKKSSKKKIDKKSPEYRHLKMKEAKERMIQKQKDKVWHKDIHIICYASIMNLPRWYLKEVKCLLVDEAHTAYASTIKKLILSLDGVGYMYGLSATPWRDAKHENFVLKSLFNNKVLYDYSIEEAIEDGVHAKVELLLINSMEPEKFLKKEKNPRVIMDEGIIRNDARNGQIAKIAFEEASNGRSVFIGIDEDGQFNGKPDDENKSYCLKDKLAKYKGLDVYYISGDLTLKEKIEEIAKIRENKTGYVVVGTMAFGIAVDVPDIDVAIHASWGKSSIRLIQRSGRAARTGGKEKTMRIYLMWDWFNNALKKQSKERIKSACEYYKTSIQV